jgi:hypothetical protein
MPHPSKTLRQSRAIRQLDGFAQTIAEDVALAENYNLFTPIPAIGSQTAAIVMGELPSPRPAKTAAYAGLSPCENARARPRDQRAFPAASSRNDAHDHVGTLRTFMLEKVRMISGIRTSVRREAAIQPEEPQK